VTSIGDNAFGYCSGLTNIEVEENNSVYKSIEGNLYAKDGLNATLIQYAIGKTAASFTIPDCVTGIVNYAFSGCISLTSVVIPDSVTRMGGCVFYDCDNLTIYCEAASQPSGWAGNWNYDNRPVVWGYEG